MAVERPAGRLAGHEISRYLEEVRRGLAPLEVRERRLVALPLFLLPEVGNRHFSARPPNVAGPRLSLAGAFHVISQPVAFPYGEWIDACGLQRADVQEQVRAAGVVADEAIAALGVPHFQFSGGHRAIPIFAFSQRMMLKVSGQFVAGYCFGPTFLASTSATTTRMPGM
jgi:hypothetical protein